MKLKIALLAVLGLLVFAAGAEAFRWHIRYYPTKHRNIELAREICQEERECEAYAGNACWRISHSRIDCWVTTWYPDEEYAEQVYCREKAHWGVNRRGYEVLKGLGRPRCFHE